MSDVLSDRQGRVMWITLNRTHKHNAFDDILIADIQTALDAAIDDTHVRTIVLKAHGTHFSAGADLNWMKRMATYSEAENKTDAMALATLMYRLHHSPKPTIAMVQGAAMGGGAGLVAACDIAIAATTARFSFSEVRLGLIPAVISPYVIRAVGARMAARLFMSAEVIDATRALALQLIHHCVAEEALLSFTDTYAQQLAALAPHAVMAAKRLVATVSQAPIDDAMVELTAALIAKTRLSTEAQQGMAAFLAKTTPIWD